MQTLSMRINYTINENLSIFVQHLNSKNKSTLGSDDIRDKNMSIQNTMLGFSMETL